MKRQQYALDIKEHGTQWIGRIPDGWSLVRLKKYIDLQNGYPFDSSFFNPTQGIRLVRIRDLVDSGAETFYDGPIPQNAIVQNNDLLIGMDGDFNICWWQGGEAVLNQRLCCLRSRDGLNKRFLYYAIPWPLKIVNDVTFFTTVKHLSSSQIQKTVIPLPTMAQQQLIAAYLDRRTEAIDTFIKKKQHLIELLQEKRQVLITQAVTKGLDLSVPMKDSGIEWLGEIPAHWSTTKIRRVFADIGSGTTPPSQDTSYYDGDIPWVNTGELNDNFILSTTKTVTQKALHDFSVLRMYPKETLLIALYGATIGKLGILGCNAVTNQACCAMTKPRGVDVKYVFYWLYAKRKDIIAMGYGGGQPNISQEVVKQLKLPLPPMDEQLAIVQALDHMSEQTNVVVDLVENQIARLHEYHQALISAAVTGKIDVREEVAACP